MSELQIVLSIVGALFLLSATGAAIWASFRSTDQDARIKRLQGERDDLLSRLTVEQRVARLDRNLRASGQAPT